MKLKNLCATEHQDQAAFMAWLCRFHPEVYRMTFHIPNGRMSAREGAKYKSVGAKSGVPDICVAIPIKPYHGLYIEFKRVDGGAGVSDTQQSWLTALNFYNYKAVVANGFDEARKEIELYFGNQRMPYVRW